MKHKFFKNKWVKVAIVVIVLAVVFFAGRGCEGPTLRSVISNTGMMGGYGYDEAYYDYAADSYYDYGMEESAYEKSSLSMDYQYYYDEPMPSSSIDLDDIDFTDAMVIKNSYLDITVDDTEEAADQITNIASKYNGYVSYSSVYENYDGSIDGSMTFRVPADKFDDAMTEVRELADVITSESINTDDVTEEYMDLDARLGTLYELEEQYLAVLDRAVSVEEILMVHDYLQTVREEIESVEGRMQYYENQAFYSTISVYLQETVSVFAEAGKWRPVEVVKEAFQSWIGSLQGLVDKAIWLVVYVWILPVGWLLWKLVRRRKK